MCIRDSDDADPRHLGGHDPKIVERGPHVEAGYVGAVQPAHQSPERLDHLAAAGARNRRKRSEDDPLGAAARDTGDRALERHDPGQPPYLGHGRRLIGVGTPAHATDRRAERGVVDRHGGAQSGRAIVHEDQLLGLVQAQSRLVGGEGHEPAPGRGGRRATRFRRIPRSLSLIHI